MEGVLIYGAYGYTGKLIVVEAVQKGWKPTVAGRNSDRVRELAEVYDLPYTSFAFDDQEAWDDALTNHKLLINCAGPFSLTIHKILPACIRNQCHYTDITGEIAVFEYIRRFHADAVTEGLVLMPEPDLTWFRLIVYLNIYMNNFLRPPHSNWPSTRLQVFQGERHYHLSTDSDRVVL